MCALGCYPLLTENKNKQLFKFNSIRLNANIIRQTHFYWQACDTSLGCRCSIMEALLGKIPTSNKALKQPHKTDEMAATL